VCQLVAKLLSGAAEENCIVGFQRVEKIQRALLARLHDKVGKEIASLFTASPASYYHTRHCMGVFIRINKLKCQPTCKAL
jgi:hypothetical protein